MTGDLAELLPQIACAYGEPFADPSAIPSFLISRTARQHVTVVLNGDGGDELLGGYPRYTLSKTQLNAARIFGALVSAPAIDRATNGLGAYSELGARAFGRLARELFHPELGCSPMRATDGTIGRGHTCSRMAGRGSLLQRWRDEWLGRAARHSDNPIDFMLCILTATRICRTTSLVKMDIATMHCSLEGRSPLLDHELIEFCASLPPALKVQERTGKYLLKRLAAKKVRGEIRGAPQAGIWNSARRGG